MSAVEVCAECDIADCHHIRERRKGINPAEIDAIISQLLDISRTHMLDIPRGKIPSMLSDVAQTSADTIKALQAQLASVTAEKDAAVARVVTQAERDVLAERQRQISAEGWTPEHDDEHANGEMAGAAACYALAGIQHWAREQAIASFWPWEKAWWKPTDPRRDMVKAGALILAEIERLDRKEGTPT